MSNDQLAQWERFQKYYYEFPTLGLRMDLSRMRFADDYLERMESRLQAALKEMEALEAGAIANPDEGRMVGHYWLRKPELAPTMQIREDIEATLRRIQSFAAEVHSGAVKGQGGAFEYLLIIGIGGSCLGPQFVANALGHPRTNRLTPFFFDNTDPDGIERVLAGLGGRLGQTLCLVISKSGGTKETRNGMLEAVAAYKKAGLDFGRHAVAITRDDSQLHKVATQHGWITTFPMWDWVGGRTSELSAVGLLPAALQGMDVQGMVAGARACDEVTRAKGFRGNPAAQLALMWFYAGGGIGSKNMVVLPYSDRLDLFSKYLQQLVMESLGKELDRDGSVVHQGITVLGNKGATDQHSYIQQLRDGRHDFFATFIEVLRPSRPTGVNVDADFTSDDYLAGFYLGTRQALAENSRDAISITIDEVTPQSVGTLIALFERAVGLYASLINVNAYHQPGVEAGKKAAESVLALQLRIVSLLKSKAGQCFGCAEIARLLDVPLEVEHVFKVCERLALKSGSGMLKETGRTSVESKFGLAANRAA